VYPSVQRAQEARTLFFLFFFFLFSSDIDTVIPTVPEELLFQHFLLTCPSSVGNRWFPPPVLFSFGVLREIPFLMLRDGGREGLVLFSLFFFFLFPLLSISEHKVLLALFFLFSAILPLGPRSRRIAWLRFSRSFSFFFFFSSTIHARANRRAHGFPHFDAQPNVANLL